MAYVITGACINCCSCESVCPVGAISMGEDHMQIDKETCVGCGTCADGCPMVAIAPEE